ncbi:hypothetical protein [Antarctobacter heliothermus]|uniref:Periplasmic protein n=1 Tax=Antarctobacter heliothermus TaxID=74033 RepID=A0A239IUQ0_9RHOB|nr:hypothetical protein [Antarctobacter heliothermus]SNS97317.1 hypothetical protein SAMN04488078_104613 [Antarctobacter heliothermus]
MTTIVRLLTSLTFLVIAGPALAGTWSKLTPTGYGDCALLFEGPIAKGDLTRAIDDGLLDDFAPRICLNSPGGSLAEVLAFLEASDRPENGFYFGTRVRTGDECLSSCAILFMFGLSFGANSPSPSRQLAPGARLGFHSPFIRDGAAPATSDAEVFSVALQVVKLLADRSYKATSTAGPALPQELLALVLGTPSAEMHYVDTFAEARLLGIEMTQNIESNTIFTDTPENMDRLARQICQSSHTLTFRQSFVKEGYDFDDLIARASDPTKADIVFPGNHQVHFRGRVQPQTNQPEKYISVLTGPGYFQPHWNSAGSSMYCRVELQIKRVRGGAQIPYYTADFSFLGLVDLTRDPGQTTTFWEMSIGLLPLSTRY